MFKVKICGITTPDDALLAAEAGADAIGLNFYAKSPRCVLADRAAEIVQRLREDYSAAQVRVFGVFVNAAVDEILWMVREADLYGVEKGFGVQLHGDEPPQLLQQLRQHGIGCMGNLFQATGHTPEVPVMRAFRCRGADLSSEAAYLTECQKLDAMPQAVLLDAYSSEDFGGTGQCVDWATVHRQRSQLPRIPLILAGGLTATNVARAIEEARPDGVDVASGVESAPGKKDAAKVYAFVAAANKQFVS